MGHAKGDPAPFDTLRTGIVDDQISNPTWASMLAEVTGLILARGVEYIEERKGLYHLAGDGFATCLRVRTGRAAKPGRKRS